HRHGAVHRRGPDPRDAEIKELEAKVDALTQRLDQQEAREQATQQQAQGAAAAAAAAQAQAANALSQTQAAQVQVAKVENQVPPLEKAVKGGWFANTSVSGKSFFNVSNIHQSSVDLLGNKTDSAQNGTQTELKRFYVSVDHKFNDVFSADITTDFRYNSNGTSKDTLVYVKKAYLQAKFDPALIVRVGAADLPWVPFDESAYGFRFVENTLIDRTKFGTSSDWGVHVLGSFADNLVSYQVSAIDGQGYKTLSRSSDTLDLEGRVSVNPLKVFTIAVGGYTGKLGKSAGNLSDTATPHTASRFDALAAYTDKRIRAGVEYFAAKNWNNVTTAANDKSDGWSAFGSFAFTPQIIAFGRYDWVKPSKDINPALKDHYFNLGLDYKPLPPLDFALVYKRDRANHGLISTSNGTIGGPAYGTYDELGLFGQLVF
ncbi:MAG TPA: porin, partial [Sphingomicrobium sp.]|nr:porin [Sphingomicrobium sp.]